MTYRCGFLLLLPPFLRRRLCRRVSGEFVAGVRFRLAAESAHLHVLV